MKLSHGLGLALAGVCSVGLFVAGGLAGCGSSSGGGGGGTGGDLCSGLPPSACSSPPAMPSAPKTSKTTPHNYALHHLFLGDTDRMQVTNPSAWETYGYNLDGKVTTAGSTDVCTLQPGASKQTQLDGPGGVDNSFGANIIPIVDTLVSSPTSTINNAIQGGSFTVMTYVVGFDDSASNTTSATGLTGVLLAGGKYPADAGAALSWDTNTHWPILPGLIQGCTSTGGCPSGTDPIAKASVQFPSAFQTKGTFVNGSPADISISLSIGGQNLSITVHSGVITFAPSAPGSVTNGIIAGVLNTMELINGLRSVAGNLSTSLCTGSAFDSIASQISQTSDIGIDSSGKVVNNAGTPCNAISIGLGFDSSEIALPTAGDILPGSPPPPDKCADAGGATD